jgi:hypothetical protein
MNILVHLSSMFFKHMQPADRSIHMLFSIKTHMHTNMSSKTTYSIKTSLLKTMLYMLMQVSSWELPQELMGFNPSTSWKLIQAS